MPCVANVNHDQDVLTLISRPVFACPFVGFSLLCLSAMNLGAHPIPHSRLMGLVHGTQLNALLRGYPATFHLFLLSGYIECHALT
jgi:hypothetical protein